MSVRSVVLLLVLAGILFASGCAIPLKGRTENPTPGAPATIDAAVPRHPAVLDAAFVTASLTSMGEIEQVIRNITTATAEGDLHALGTNGSRLSTLATTWSARLQDVPVSETMKETKALYLKTLEEQIALGEEAAKVRLLPTAGEPGGLTRQAANVSDLIRKSYDSLDRLLTNSTYGRG
jgi:hypothetical protein